MKTFGCVGILIALIVIFALSAIGVFIVQLLWNNIAPWFWTGAPELGFWQTFLVLVFLNIVGGVLFGRSK